MKTAVITGASSGLGAALKFSLEYTPFEQHSNPDRSAPWRGNVYDWSKPGVDVRDRVSIIHASEALPDKVDVLINCAGINGIAYWPDLKEAEWDNIMMTNVKSIYLCTQVLLERLQGGTIVNIVSNASHVPMTSSAAYNASKGAAAILTKQMARELKKTHDITVFAISPNKLKGTGMSHYIEQQVMALRGWTKEQADVYQLAALPAGHETEPKIVAELIAFLLSSKERHSYLAGCDLMLGGP